MNFATGGLKAVSVDLGLKVKNAVLDGLLFCLFFYTFTISRGKSDIFFISPLKNINDKLCLICHEEIRNNSGGAQELHCTHRFHKEVKHLVTGTACPLLLAVFALACPSQRKLLLFLHLSPSACQLSG